METLFLFFQLGEKKRLKLNKSLFKNLPYSPKIGDKIKNKIKGKRLSLDLKNNFQNRKSITVEMGC